MGAVDPKGHAAWHRRPTPFRPRLGRQDGIPKRKLQDKAFLYLKQCVGQPLKMLLESLKILLESYKMGVQF